MTWAKPEYSRKRVNAAGRVLVGHNTNETDRLEALEVLNNWRASHSFPLNSIQINLRSKSRKVYGKALVAQRLKRISSIIPKLTRYPEMKLSQMQDIGGCRAVVRSVQDVYAVLDSYRNSRSQHELMRIDDYIARPKRSGYRGIHLIYKFQSQESPEYQNLKIEVQLRSHIQHAWATAVETVGTFLHQALKSSEGEERWLELFRLASAAFSLREGNVPVPSIDISREELRRRIRDLHGELEVRRKLDQFRMALTLPKHEMLKNASYYLLSLSPREHTLRVRPFRRRELEQATKEYLRAEEQRSLFPEDIVLVAADDLKALRRAYPNYFLDTQVFLRELDRFVEAKGEKS